MIASLAALALAAGTGSDPHALANLYLAWRGGPRLEKLTSMHARGSIKVMGLGGTIDRWSTSDGSEREDRDLTVFKVSEGNGPAGGWSRGPGGQVDRLSPAATMALVEDAGVDFGSALREPQGVALTELGDEVRAGRAWKVLRVSYASGSTYDMLIDGATGELEGERITRDGRSKLIEFSDWRMVEGVRVAFRESASGALPGETRQVAYLSVELNVRPGAALLSRPAPREIAVFDAGHRSTGPLHIDIFDGRRIFVDVKVGGRKVAAMIDSGAASSVVDTAFASATGVRSSGGGSVIGAGGTAAVAMGSSEDVRLGSLTLKALPLAVMDLSGISSQLGRSLNLVIGRDLFDQLIVTIDAQARTITLSEPASFKPKRGATAVEVTAEGPLRIVQATIEGGKPAKLHFDLGNGTPLVLYPAYWQRAALADGRRSSRTLVGGVGGSVAAETVATRSLVFGGVRFSDVPTILMPATGGAGDNTRVDGNLGFPVLSRFRISIDYTHDRMWLTPTKRGATVEFDRDRSGLGFLAGPNGLTVKLVAPKSAASAAGVHAGDVIVSIDGRRVGADYVASGLSRWRTAPAGRHVTLTLSDGSIRRLTLADLY
ncbi:aspartyl protease family protein [Sphingomonas sp. UYP23]